MRTIVFLTIALSLAAGNAIAGLTTYGWEDGGTVLGVSPPGGIIVSNVGAPDPVYAGASSLKLVDNSPTTLPVPYVAWVKGLLTGDVVTASFWVYDTTPNAAPSGRIWGHYTSGGDINSYAGAAWGNTTHSAGTGWSQSSWSWTFDAGTDRDGLVIEVGTYTYPGHKLWIDDLEVHAPDHATVVTPLVPEPGTFLALGLGLASMAGFLRRNPM